MNKKLLIWGAVFGMLTVIFGAFGAHALRTLLEQNRRLDTFETAVLYQAIHAVAILLIGILQKSISRDSMKYSGYSFIAGVILFSGSLYFLSILNIGWFGAIAPIGGLLLILGWVLLIYSIVKTRF